MTSLIGLHMTRNGIGQYPARAVLSINGNGLGAGEQAPGTLHIFRDTTVYKDGPPDLMSNPLYGDIEFARYWYDQLRPIWQRNPADYYTITNELSGTDNPEHMERHVAYEANICALAAADGLKCVVGKLAGGSPHMEHWRNIYLPHIMQMWQRYGAIYGRHAYGSPLVAANGTVTQGNADRPITEAVMLKAAGYSGGLVIAECGLNGGYGVVGYDEWYSQITRYEQALRPYADVIIGLCWWELGKTEFNADYTNHLKQLRPYAEANQIGAWTPNSQPQPPPDDRHKAIVVKAPQEIGLSEWLALAQYAYQFRHTMTASHDDAITVIGAGNTDSYAKIYKPTLASQQATITALEAAGLSWEPLTLGTTPPPKPPPQGELIDVGSFMLADPIAWRVVRNPQGQQEDIRDMVLRDGMWVRAKNSLGEWWRIDGGHAWLIHDTSPAPQSDGTERVYTLYTGGIVGAVKNPTQMRVNQAWQETTTHRVQFRAKSGCGLLSENSGNAQNACTLTRYARNYTFNSYGQNITLDEVIWLQTGVETQVYAKHNGRVVGWCGWEAPWGKSELVELHWDRGALLTEPNRWCNFE